MQTTAPTSPGTPGVRKHPWLPWVLAVIGGCLAVTLMRPWLRREPQPPPVIASLPAFSLVDSEGRPFGRGDLDGTAWIVGFFFTRCRTACPLITAAMADLRDRLEAQQVNGVRMIGLTVDPEHDDPAVLREWGRDRGIEPRRWLLLTGEPADVRALVEGAFRTAMGRPEEVAGAIDIAHTGRLALVDPQGRIRGYYGIDEAGLDETFHRALQVRDEDPAAVAQADGRSDGP